MVLALGAVCVNRISMYPYINEALWPLIDACGPEREVGFGNPKPRPLPSPPTEEGK